MSEPSGIRERSSPRIGTFGPYRCGTPVRSVASGLVMAVVMAVVTGQVMRALLRSAAARSSPTK